MHADATDYYVEIIEDNGVIATMILSEADLALSIANYVQANVVKPGHSIEVTEGELIQRKGDDVTTMTWINAEYV